MTTAFHDSMDNLSMISEGDGSSNDGSEGERMTRQENEARSRIRSLAVGALTITTVVISVIVFVATSQHEQNSYRDAFRDTSNKLVADIQSNFERKLATIDGLAIGLSSIAKTEHKTWPNLTIQEFNRQASNTRSLMGAKTIVLLPVVGDKVAWEQYASQHSDDWTGPGITSQTSANVRRSIQRTRQLDQGQIHEHIFNIDGSEPNSDDNLFLPVWQTSPVNTALLEFVNLNMMSIPSPGLNDTIFKQTPCLGYVLNLQDDSSDRLVYGSPTDAFIAAISDGFTEPVSALYYPILNDNNMLAAVLLATISWKSLLGDSLQHSAEKLDCVVLNQCGQEFTYTIGGDIPSYIGRGDLRTHKGGNMVNMVNISTLAAMGELVVPSDACAYSIIMSPSHEMHKYFINGSPVLYSGFVTFFFIFSVVIFLVYDLAVESRQRALLAHAQRSARIISNLFPSNVRERLYQGEHNMDDEEHGFGNLLSFVSGPSRSSRLQTFLSHQGIDSTSSNINNQNVVISRPIADLFPHCTVLFADIAGFTAWSSSREPSQVFTLLENVYQAFDRIARKRQVFKVETIGDSYVAVTGLPEPQDNHAIIMARFARDCRTRMEEVTRQLETTLGPDTGDLCMRFGLHSGPVTAGVLKGEKSRFQLFGDTVNTAARMESTGQRDKIQCSQSTANLIMAAGKGHWLVSRSDKVQAKGKGEMQTFFIDFSRSDPRKRRGSLSSCESRSSMSSVATDDNGTESRIWGETVEIPEEVDSVRSKHQRLIDFNVDLLSKHLKNIVARRKMLLMAGRRCSQGGFAPRLHNFAVEEGESTVLSEVVEVIRLPNFDAKSFKKHINPETIVLDQQVMAELRRYVTIIASMYRNNPFHNFEHCSHVTMSVNKLLHRVVDPSAICRTGTQVNNPLSTSIASDLHKYTFGITSDPLTQFGIVFGALIHDADHWGVSNAQLIKEGAPMAVKYGGKSVAEQNSVDLAWNLLLDNDEFGALQNVIFQTDAEYKRFRQVVVNVVMATDIFDADLIEMRACRWEKAFSYSADPDDDTTNRKATIVIDYIIQAADVAHAMQHWKVYQKWNRRLFDELYTAWRAGRMSADPAGFWHKGELDFFDKHVIPLAEKLKECGVFGVSSDECLAYALQNRSEWEAKGEDIVTELVNNYQQRELEEKRAVEQARDEKKKRSRFTRRRSLFASGG